MKLFLTGATGFIGSHIARNLCRNGHELVCMKRSHSSIARCLDFAESVVWVNVDDENWDTAVKRFAPEIFIHTAWSGVDYANRDSFRKQLENITFQQILLDLAVKVGAKKFVGFGSQAEYGTFSGCIDETYPAYPVSAYGVAKLASLNILKCFCEINKIKWYWLRQFPCFGEHEGEQWLIPSAIKSMLAGTEMDFTPGEQRYSYMYVEEIASVVEKLITSDVEEGVYNISSSRSISIKNLLEKLQLMVNPKFKLNFGALPYRSGQSMWMQGNNRKISEAVGAVIDVANFDIQLKQTVVFYKKKYEQ